MYATDQHLMMRSSIIVILFFSIFHVSCSGNQQREKADEGDREEAGRTVPQNSVRAGFPFPDIPSVLTSPEGRKAYLLRHYWDGFNFADSALVNSKETAEQGLADYFHYYQTKLLTVCWQLKAWRVSVPAWKGTGIREQSL